MIYKIVTAASWTLLENEVSKEIENGFQPHGSMVYGNTMFFQPMTKEEEKDDSGTVRKLTVKEG